MFLCILFSDNPAVSFKNSKYLVMVATPLPLTVVPMDCGLLENNERLEVPFGPSWSAMTCWSFPIRAVASVLGLSRKPVRNLIGSKLSNDLNLLQERTFKISWMRNGRCTSDSPEYMTDSTPCYSAQWCTEKRFVSREGKVFFHHRLDVHKRAHDWHTSDYPILLTFQSSTLAKSRSRGTTGGYDHHHRLQGRQLKNTVWM